MKRNEFLKRLTGVAASTLAVPLLPAPAAETLDPGYDAVCPHCGDRLMGAIRLTGQHTHVTGKSPSGTETWTGTRSISVCGQCFQPRR